MDLDELAERDYIVKKELYNADFHLRRDSNIVSELTA